MYSQFVTAEGKHLSTLIAGGLAASAGGHNIHKDVRSLKRLKNCKRIKTKYRDLALRHHPDKDGNEEDFVTLTEAKEEALESCTNNSDDGPPRMRRHASGRSKNKNAKHKTTSNKKKAKHRRKRDRRQKKKEEEGMSDIQKSILSGAVVVGAGELIRRHATGPPGPPPRLRRQRSEEDYIKATGHPRRR